MSDEMAIFTKAGNLLDWLLNATEKFPRAQRFIVTKRLLDAAFNFQERITEANTFPAKRRADRADKLHQADAELLKLRLYLRIARKRQWLSDGAYEHVSEMIAEVGKLLGGWIRTTLKQ